MKGERNEACFYCEAPTTKANLEMDHFPIPKQAGGTEVVPACRTCHDAVDRFEMFELVGLFAKAIRDSSREQRWLLARTIKLLHVMNQRTVPKP